MKKLLGVVAAVAAFSMSTVGARAELLTMDLTDASHMSMAALLFGAVPFSPQGLGADDTTFSGTITVDVDSLIAPNTITIVSANVVAANSGQWLPKIGPTAEEYTPADWANYGLEYATTKPLILLAFRNNAYDLSSGAEAVDLDGNFSSATESLLFRAGATVDYWFDPSAGSFGGDTLDLEGASTNEASDPSSYVVSDENVATLTVPIFITFTEPDSGLVLIREGFFVATKDVPEPATWVLMGLGMIGLVGVARRKYGR